MTATARRLALLATTSVLAFATVACGSSTAPSGSTAPASVAASAPASVEASPSAVVSPSPATSAGASAAASAPASAGASPGGSLNVPSFHEAPDLEAALPDQVGGQTLQKLSVSGSGALAVGAQSQEFQQLLGGLGKSPSDLTLGVGAGAGFTIGVFRIAGVNADVLLNAFIESARKQEASTQVTDANRGGKSVKKVANGSETTWVYGSGDKVFFVQSGTDALVDEALSKLP
jgi:hypothetical protein